MDEKRNYEELLESCGGFGRYQLMISLINCLFCFYAASGFLFMIPASAPVAADCLNGSSLDGNLSCLSSRFYSIAYEWKLVGAEAPVPSLTASAQQAGHLLGGILFGLLSDKFGRKKVFSWLVLPSIGATVLSSLALSWKTFLASRILVGFLLEGAFATSYVLLSETLPQRWRMLSYVPGWTLGFIIFYVECYFISKWRLLNYISIIPSVGGIALILYATESPKWLLERKRNVEARKALVYIMKQNGTKHSNEKDKINEYSDELETLAVDRTEIGQIPHLNEENVPNKTYTYWHLFENRQTALLSISLAYTWFSAMIVSTALRYALGSLSGHICINNLYPMLLRLVVEVGVLFIDRYNTAERLGRKTFLYIGYALAGCALTFICVGLIFGLVNSQDLSVRICAIIAISTTALLWAGACLLSIESFPTALRNMGNSMCSFVSAVAGILAPQVAYTFNYWEPAPFVITLIVMIVNLALLIFFVPETKNKELPDLNKDFKIEW